MIIQLKKFGTTLISRPSGKEALLAYTHTLDQVNQKEEILIDFSGVIVLTPSWADEFLTPIFKRFRKRVTLQNTNNPSIKATLSILNHFQDFKVKISKIPSTKNSWSSRRAIGRQASNFLIWKWFHLLSKLKKALFLGSFLIYSRGREVRHEWNERQFWVKRRKSSRGRFADLIPSF